MEYPVSPVQNITLKKGDIIRQRGRGWWVRGEAKAMQDHVSGIREIHPGASFLFLEEVLDNVVIRCGSVFTGDKWERYQVESKKYDTNPLFHFTYDLSN